MKKIKTTIHALAVLLVAVVATTACSSGDDNIIGEQPTPDIRHPTTNYTMTVEATKGDDATPAPSASATTARRSTASGRRARKCGYIVNTKKMIGES